MSEVKLYRVAPAETLLFRDENGDQTVEGLVVPYDTWSEVDSVMEGHFMERFGAGSMKKTFSEGMRRAKGYFEHGRSRMFDRTPIMDVTEAWETPQGPMFRATLLRGLPEWMVDGLRRGLYGVSVGAEPIKVERNQRPKASAYNPKGLEERTYREMRAFDISLTPSPHYEQATAMLRSITDELAVEALVSQPEKLLHLLREVQEAEPPHSEPDAPEPEVPTPPDDPEQTEEVAPEETPDEPETEDDSEDVEASRDTQPPIKDYLSEEDEKEWRL